jgi:multidrug efflux system outer membrane protein
MPVKAHARYGKQTARAVALGAAALVLAACSFMPQISTPSRSLPFGTAGSDEATQVRAQTAWWQAFRDPILNDLVERGLSENLTLQQALERVRAAEAVVRGSGSVLDGDADIGVERNGRKNFPDTTQASTGLGVSWLIDIFGEARFDRAAAEANLKSVTAQSQAARMLYLAQITQAYVDLRFFEANVARAKADVVARRRTLSETESLVQSGEVTLLELTRAQSLLDTARVEIPVFEASAQAQRNRITTLLGLPAGSLNFSGPIGQPEPRKTPTDGVPADIVRSRPDVLSAEYDYQADLSRLGVAKAQIYPSLRLNGTIQSGAVDSTNFSNWSFGPTLTIPVFNRGVLKANIDIAESSANESYLAWRESVLNAVEEVESALYAVEKYSTAVDASRELVRTDTRSLGLLRDLLAVSEVTVLDVIEIERRASQGRAILISNLRELSLQYIALNVALGAGYATSGS